MDTISSGPTDTPPPGPTVPGCSSEFHRRFRILGLLGEGSMGTVYRAHQLSLERDVALKVLKRMDQDQAARFLREGKILASVACPQIVKVYDAAFDGSIPYIACELIEGETLQRRAERAPLPIEEALRVATELSMALVFAHERGVIHRDVKPENAFVCTDGSVKLGDFGLARELAVGEAITRSGVIVGTPAYMSPEQVRGGRVGPESDQYSLGVLLYWLTTRTFPFEGTGPLMMALARLAESPRPARVRCPDLPDPVEALIMRALSRDPAERFPSSSEMVDELRRVRCDLVGGEESPPGDLDSATREKGCSRGQGRSGGVDRLHSSGRTVAAPRRTTASRTRALTVSLRPCAADRSQPDPTAGDEQAHDYRWLRVTGGIAVALLATALAVGLAVRPRPSRSPASEREAAPGRALRAGEHGVEHGAPPQTPASPVTEPALCRRHRR